MSAKYSLKDFMCDFIAFESPEVLKLGYTPEQRGVAMRRYFKEHYGENGEAFGALHCKALLVLVRYIEEKRPDLAQRVEKTPHSLLIAIFYLLTERGIDDPTNEQIELAERAQAPRN